VITDPPTDEEPGSDEDFESEQYDAIDRAAIERMQTVATVLDESIPIPGTSFRIGIDPLIGLLPVGGDAVSTVASLYIVLESARLGVQSTTLVRMLANLGVDLAVGSIPLVGDAFDAAWKANKRNVALALSELGADSSDAAGP